MRADLRDLLELASDEVPETDLAPEAWDEARRRHRAVARRTVVGVGVVAAAGVAVGVVLRRTGADPLGLDPADALPTTSEEGRLPSVDVDGVEVFLAPDPIVEGRLPRYPRARALALPRRIGPGDPAARAVLGVGGIRGVAEPVRAVFLVGADGGRLSPVLYAPGAPVTHVLVPSVRVSLGEGSATTFGPRAMSDDRHRVVFAQPSRLVVLDARNGSVVEIEVPDPTLNGAGWARDGVTLVARGRDGGWLAEPETGVVRRATGPVLPDWFDLEDVGGATGLRSYTGGGEFAGTTPLQGPPVVPSNAPVSNLEGWLAGGAYLPGPYQEEALRSQGLVAVQSEPRPTPRVLAATTGSLIPKGNYRALVWAPEDVVILESRSERPGFQGTVRRILAWDVIGARLWQVADLEAAARGMGQFSGTYAL